MSDNKDFRLIGQIGGHVLHAPCYLMYAYGVLCAHAGITNVAHKAAELAATATVHALRAYGIYVLLLRQL